MITEAGVGRWTSNDKSYVYQFWFIRNLNASNVASNVASNKAVFHLITNIILYHDICISRKIDDYCRIFKNIDNQVQIAW